MKQCQRCGGNLFPQEKGYACLQCGCEHDNQGAMIKARFSLLSSPQRGISGKADKFSRLMEGNPKDLSNV